MKNLFDVIPEKFFRVFFGENKRVHADIMSCMYHTLNDSTTILKSELLESVEDYCSRNDLGQLTDEFGNDISDRSSKEKARSEYNIFKKNGWLNDEIIKDYSTLVTFDDNALSVMKLLEDIKRDNTQLEYGGFVRTIVKLIGQFDWTYATLEQIHKNTKDLSILLGRINSSIRKYLNELLRENSEDLNKLLENLLGTYQQNVVGKAFTNLKTIDNPTKYKLTILEKLETMLIDFNVSKVMESYKKTKTTNLSDDEIRELIIDTINYVYDKFDCIEDTISLIDKNNSKYVSSTTKKCKFLMNDSVDIVGVIDSLLKDIKNTEDAEIYEDVFSLYSTTQVDESSMFIPNKKIERKSNHKLVDVIQIDPEEIEKRKNILFKVDNFSVDAINQYVLRKLEDTDKLIASDLVNEESIYLSRVILIRLYENNKKTNYSINLLGYTIRKYGFLFEDYEITRGVKKDGR